MCHLPPGDPLILPHAEVRRELLAGRPAPPDRRSTRPIARRARRTRSPGGRSGGSVGWRGGPASCHNSRRDRRSGRGADEPTACRVSGTLHTQATGEEPAPDLVQMLTSHDSPPEEEILLSIRVRRQRKPLTLLKNFTLGRCSRRAPPVSACGAIQVARLRQILDAGLATNGLGIQPHELHDSIGHVRD